MRIHKISPRFIFCEGEIGVDDFSEYLELIPEIDLVYSAPPKPEYFSMWYQLAGKEKIPSLAFYEGFFAILRELDASQYHIEVGHSNEQQVREFFTCWRAFDWRFQRTLLYSAPVDCTGRLAKCKKPTEMLVRSNFPVTITAGSYSHQYLDQLLAGFEHLNVFDPTMGKGLLARYALKYGHSCFGIEMNPDRLNVAIEFIERNTNQLTLEVN